MKQCIRITPQDNVATLLIDLDKDAWLTLEDGSRIQAAEDIPYGHKIALAEIAQGAAVVKYNEIIGRATETIRVGQWVHIHNCVSDRGGEKR